MAIKKVLIVSYTFPPYPGIGGRRWAKFAKYFSSKGVDVHVLAASNPFKETSKWENDVKNLVGKVTYFNSNYPKYLWIQPTSFFEKIAYRLALLYAKIKTNANPYDRSAHCRKQLVQLVEEKIKEGFNNVVVSCGHFTYLTFLLPLINKYKDVRFIADFRDPWVNNRTNFGYENLSKKRQQKEKENEELVAKSYHLITTVADEMTDYFSKLSGQNEKCLTLLNGFDPNDYTDLSAKADSNELTFILAGTLYQKSLKNFKILLDTLAIIKENNSEIYSQMCFKFYGRTHNEFKELAQEKNIEIIKFFEPIPLKEVYQQIQKAHIGMLFLTEDIDYSFSTKFCEYIAFNKTIAVFGSNTKTGQFVEQHGIGYHIQPNNATETLLKISEDFEKSELKFNPDFDKSKFSVEQLADKYISLLQ